VEGDHIGIGQLVWRRTDRDIFGLATDPHGLTRTKNVFANAKKPKRKSRVYILYKAQSVWSTA